jgi:hypothetical protein
MNAREMHYDFKQKLNRIDSQRFRDLIVPEIDWKLNEAQEVFVRIIAEPRFKEDYGFESNTRTINDIRTIVVDQIPAIGVVPTVFDTKSYIAVPPTDYWYLVGCKVLATKGNCANVQISATEVQHDDESELSVFDRSSFEWKKINIRFNKDGLRVFTDGTFSISKVLFEYIKQPILIHNAQDYVGNNYNTLDGINLTGTQACELPPRTHREVVDLAVLITAGDLSLPDYQLKYNKLKLTA